jgi:hypothetical protein
MKKILLILGVLINLNFLFSQSTNCVKVDSIYTTSKLEKLNSRDIRSGIRQMVEEELQEKFCLSNDGESIKINIFYFGQPKKTLRILGVENTEAKTQVGIKLYYKDKIIEGIGESEIEVSAVFLELNDSFVPFNQSVLSSAIKKAIVQCISKL